MKPVKIIFDYTSAAYDPSQPRDESGQWTNTGGVATGVPGAGQVTPAQPKMPKPAPLKKVDDFPSVNDYQAHFKKYVIDMIESGHGEELKQLDSNLRSLAVFKYGKTDITPADQRVMAIFHDDPDWTIRMDVASDADQKTLHKMVNDPEKAVREMVVERIDQEGLHKMVNDDYADIRVTVAERIDQAGLHKMMNDPNWDVYEAVALRVGKTGLDEMIASGNINTRSFEGMFRDKPTVGRIDDLNNKMIHRQERLKVVQDTIDVFNKTGKIEFSPETKEKIKTFINNGGESREFVAINDEFYKFAADGKYEKFHSKSKQDWEGSSSNRMALALKDSVARQYGGEIRYHDKITDYEYELNNNIYPDFPKETVDEYVRLQKGMTKAYLDEMYPDTNELIIWRGTTKEELNMNGREFKIEDNTALQVKSNPVSSWTLQPQVAEKFARRNEGVVLKTKVTKDEIWSSFMTHAYGGEEREMLLIGNKDRIADVRLPAAGAAYDPNQPRDENGQWAETGALKTYKDAQDWIAAKSREYGGQNKFFGAKEGQRVFYDVLGTFGAVDKQDGTIYFDKSGLPNPVSSWSLRPEVARNFANRESGIVPKSDVWSSFMSHAYGGMEREILLIGKDRKANIKIPENT